MADDRYTLRSIYLQGLDLRSRDDPHEYWMPEQIVTEFSNVEIVDALHYLGEKGLAEVLYSGGDYGIAPARITWQGQDFLQQASTYVESHGDLASLARATINYTTNNTTNNTTLTNSTATTVTTGGSGHTFSGVFTAIQGPRADEIGDALQHLTAEIADDENLPIHIKEEANEHVQAVGMELSKPESERSVEKIQHRWDRLLSLLPSAPATLDLANTVGKLILAAQGSGLVS